MNVQFPRFDLYRELGVDATAGQEEITAAWKAEIERARAAGPAAQRIQRLNTAHQWLGNPERRAQYDRELARRATAGAAAADRQASRPPASRPPAARPASQRVQGAVRPRPSAARSLPLWGLIGAVAVVLLVVVAIVRPFDGGGGAGAGSTASPSASAAVGADGCPTSQPPALPAGTSRIVTIETSLGTMELTIEADPSPIAAGNFVALAECGYYDGVVFHRTPTLASGAAFVIQGGDPTGTGSGGPGYTIQDETVTREYHRGTVAMARTSQPNSVGSQFFVVLSEEARGPLESANTYQIIGSVTSGLEVADAIHAASAGVELPTEPVAMTKVTVSNP